MKKTLSHVCGLGAMVALVLAGAENPDGSCNVAWSLGFMALAGILAAAFSHLRKSAGHV